MRDKIRTVHFRPYRKGMGPSFTLTVFDTGQTIMQGKARLAYTLAMSENRHRTIIFEGDDFGCSPMHAIDSDAAVSGLMGFLTLRPGDTDAEYFEHYTEAQRRYCDQYAETLACEVMTRFEER